jgi:hypothetical protein
VSSVNLITAFGRGNSLALALRQAEFSVNVIDFTEALKKDHSLGAGPFPITTRTYLAQQKQLISELEPLPSGLTFWLQDGPVDLSGPMAPFYAATREFLKDTQNPQTEFAQDWMRRFLLQWTSPVSQEAWEVNSGRAFPFAADLGIWPQAGEADILKLEGAVQARGEVSVQTDATRLQALQIDGRTFAADQWVWCLSSSETRAVNAQLAQTVFNKGVWTPDWVWMQMAVRCEHGPWSDGLPAYAIVIGDLFLPWTYGNAFVLKRVESDSFQVWLKVPYLGASDSLRRTQWAQQVEQALNSRLPLARFYVEESNFLICPHSLVFSSHQREARLPVWKNWDLIAPESLDGLDWSARFEREAKTFERLMQWRLDSTRKQGAPRDRALHTP